ncbi:hypothetical protein [Spiroplasma endosymbiont of Lariophagus distinguendus]|uniref:hypothetical protein n=1 Tax=Spiroplasma endosymbiont of Lariophagus distinguendus TaxID=2935082 RepID=UPI00207A7D93|nr:hypothetical protein [Spiroplasma endosymbiont of Lariophagus distinguendus]
MRNMKTLLRLMGAAALTTVAASSVVACRTQTKAPALNGKYATLLGWYSNENTSLINQELKKDDTAGKESYSISVPAADNTKITATKFNEKLLKAGTGADSDKFQAVSDDAAAFLKDLGFTPDSKKFYSADDVKKITALSAKVESTEAGKIEAAGTTDFKVEAGTCQINIMDKATGDDAKSVKKYTINTLKKDALGVPAAVYTLVELAKLDLTKANGFEQGKDVLKSLPWKAANSKEKNLYNSLVNLFSKDKVSLVWTSDDQGQTVVPKYTDQKVYLTVKFGEVKVTNTLDFGTPQA